MQSIRCRCFPVCSSIDIQIMPVINRKQWHQRKIVILDKDKEMVRLYDILGKLRRQSAEFLVLFAPLPHCV